MNGSPADRDFVREVPKPFDPARPMRLAVEAELCRQFHAAEAAGVIGSQLSSDAEAGPTARVVMTLNLDELARAVIAHLNKGA